MQSFRFRLQRVLDWRTRSADVERTRTAQCQAALSSTHEAIARLKAESIRVEEEVLYGTRLSGQDLGALERFRLRVKKQDAALRDRQQQQKVALQAQLEALAVARRGQKSLEMLKQRRLDDHVYLENREIEEAAADAFLAKWKPR
jgi:flagellar biosynthesis chaperone FliJ